MKIHIIQKGETLTTIAAQYNVDVKTLERRNQQLVDPKVVVPGMKLMVPQQSKNLSYKAQSSQGHKHSLKVKDTTTETNKQMHPRRPIGEDMTDDVVEAEHPYNSDKAFTKKPDERNKRRKQMHPHIYCDCCQRKMFFNS